MPGPGVHFRLPANGKGQARAELPMSQLWYDSTTWSHIRLVRTMQAGPPSKVKSSVVCLGMCCGFPVISTLSSSLPGSPATVENSDPEIHTAQAKPTSQARAVLQA